ncbi:MAG TPA: phosphatase PAP2 family protein [Caulobacteraceae bacterium]
MSILAVGAFALQSFLHIMSETLVEGETRGFDLGILQALRQPGQPGVPIGPVWLTEVARDLSSLGSLSVLIFVALVVIGFALVKRRFCAAGMIVVALGGGMGVCQFLKDYFERERPPLAYRLETVVNASFPSGHAMLSAVAYLTLAVLLARVQKQKRLKAYVVAVAVITAGLVGVTRIYLGVHWTTDVLAGWSIGAAWAVTCWFASFLWERITRHRLDEPANQSAAAAKPLAPR